MSCESSSRTADVGDLKGTRGPQSEVGKRVESGVEVARGKHAALGQERRGKRVGQAVCNLAPVRMLKAESGCSCVGCMIVTTICFAYSGAPHNTRGHISICKNRVLYLYADPPTPPLPPCPRRGAGGESMTNSPGACTSLPAVPHAGSAGATAPPTAASTRRTTSPTTSPTPRRYRYRGCVLGRGAHRRGDRAAQDSHQRRDEDRGGG